MNSLREVRRGSPLGAPVPVKRSLAWIGFLDDVGLMVGLPDLLRGRSPAWVWKKLQHTAPPRRPSWAALLAGWLDTDPGRLRVALTADPATAFFSLTTWNVSWLVDAATDVARAKKVCVEEELGRGRPVCLQETHWTVADGSLWPLGLLVRNTYWSAAINRATLDAALATADPVWATGTHAHHDDIEGRLGGSLHYCRPVLNLSAMSAAF